jgi:signal transduction histidine kinase/CheY-like chemotaxis protein
MKISKLLIKRFALLTGFFLALGIIFLGFSATAAFFSRVNSTVESEANSGAGIAAQTYGQGNLVALRGSLDSLAAAHGWSEASFVNADGDQVWTSKQPGSTDTPSKAEFLVWTLASKMAGLSSKTPISLLISRDVTDDSGEIYGKIIFVKNLIDPWRKFLVSCLVFGTCLVVIWAIFIWLCWIVSQRTLRPLAFLIGDLKTEAEKIALTFDTSKENDELQNIRIWFKELTTSWVEAQMKLVESKRDSALAQMTQMLAHDVRKPFSMLKTGLNLLQASSAEPNKFKNNLAFLVSEVDRATRSVDGMLTDVMEIGSTSTELIQEPAAPEALFESTLGEIFRVYPKSKIPIAYDLQHSSMVNVHLKKVSRIFSNIVGNAVQAINESGNFAGTLWFKTKTEGDFVQFCIGNSGSMIPPESLAKLFEAFFTSGKKGGTGLGLAIAQKVVQAHGGKIWCESSKSAEYPEGKVEFFFTLPVAAGVESETTAQLPKHSDDITQVIALLSQASHSKSDSEFNKSEGLLHQEVIQRMNSLPRPLGLLIVDDESIYRSALAGWVEESPELAQFCKIHHANGSGEAFETLKNQSIKNQTIDLIITDIDMGPKSLSGFDLVKELRTNHDFNGLIFVHSNRIVPDDHRRAGDLGADGFLPKPMAKGQLFRLILQTIYSLHPSQEAPEAALTLEPAAAQADTTSPYDLIAVIDDEEIFRDQWPAFLQGFKTVGYPTAEDFVKDWDRVSGSLVAVLTDKYLGSGLDGVKLGTMLRQKSPDLALILSTSDLSVQDTSNIFDLIVDKDALEEAPKITQYLLNKIQSEDLPSTMRKTIRSFDAQVKLLSELSENLSNLNPSSISSVIDSHLKSWGPLLKDWGEWDESARGRIKKAMSATDIDRLKHDIKGSITRVKILLRNLEGGDMDRGGVVSSLRSRAEDLGKL